MFSNFFLFPIGHLTHPPTSKVFLDFWNFFLFTWPLTLTRWLPSRDTVITKTRLALRGEEAFLTAPIIITKIRK